MANVCFNLKCYLLKSTTLTVDSLRRGGLPRSCDFRRLPGSVNYSSS